MLVDVDNDMRVVREEIFGPVAAIMPFDNEDEVVALANDTEYGLAAGVWTTNLARAHRMASRLEAGTIWVNTYRAMSPMSPRQGFKSSGVGVEHGTETIKEYTRLKSVWINTDEGPVPDPVRDAELTMPLIEVTIAEGRSADTIRRMIHEVHEAVLRTVDTRPDYIRVIVREVPRGHWATGDVTAVRDGPAITN